MNRSFRILAVVAVLAFGVAFAQNHVDRRLDPGRHPRLDRRRELVGRRRPRPASKPPTRTSTSSSAPPAAPAEQADDIEDLIAIHEIDALVILPFESDPLTEPVASVKDRGIFVTVVDRGLTRARHRGRLRRRRQPGPRPGVGRVHGRGARRRGQDRRAARHPDRHRQRALRRLHGGRRRDEHRGARQPVRELEPRRRLRGHAGLPDPLPRDRRGMGAGRRHRPRRPRGDGAGRAHRGDVRRRRRRHEGDRSSASWTAIA